VLPTAVAEQANIFRCDASKKTTALAFWETNRLALFALLEYVKDDPIFVDMVKAYTADCIAGFEPNDYGWGDKIRSKHPDVE
jgi:hypothetical protein